MADTLKQRIIELLSKDTTEFYSISDIAKKLEAAYSHAHTFVLELAREEVILIKRIGNVSVCSLNLSSPLACAYLSLLEARKAKEWKDKNPHAAKILEKIELVRDNVHAVMVKNNNVILIVPEKITNADFSMFRNRTVITFTQFMKNRQHYKDAVVIYGAEKYWSMMA